MPEFGETMGLHGSAHQKDGADEINVQDLSGVLASRQDADKLMGRPISTAVPTDGQSYVYDATLNLWKPESSIVITKHTELTDKEVAGVIDHANSSITTVKLVANTITQIITVLGTTDETTSSTSWVDVPEMSITITTVGGVILLIGTIAAHNTSSEVIYRFLCGTTYYALGMQRREVVLAAITGIAVDEPAVGEYTYKIQWRVDGGTLQNRSASYPEYEIRRLTVIEFKR